ncbi:MAG: hypothetical protein HETSPECPRED_009578 [Heterodermia speciosa]|uniref:Uncharacterized protein n=1 Tax=Heterodermia speciosa TaxID=116794 RepID=A0A8H3EQ06_9LECA|nr:MAG: hypothetical protein HETSPECPRED_009578 [Heterodermia speciosa]
MDHALCRLPFYYVRSLTSSWYVQMLEHQHTQLIAGIQELYRRLAEKEPKPDLPIEASCNGQPLTHRILEELNIITPHEWNASEKSDDSAVSSAPSDDVCGSPLSHVQPTSSSDPFQASNMHHVNAEQGAQKIPATRELTPPPTLSPPAANELTRKPTFTLQMPPPYFASPDNQSTNHSIYGAPGTDWLLDAGMPYGELGPYLQGF